jgi:hypothetical protein
VGWGKGGEMTQALYAHMNKIKIKKNKYSNYIFKKKKKLILSTALMGNRRNKGVPYQKMRNRVSMIN